MTNQKLIICNRIASVGYVKTELKRFITKEANEVKMYQTRTRVCKSGWDR